MDVPFKQLIVDAIAAVRDVQKRLNVTFEASEQVIVVVFLLQCVVLLIAVQ